MDRLGGRKLEPEPGVMQGWVLALLSPASYPLLGCMISLAHAGLVLLFAIQLLA
jgi:hypothetical protein